MSVDRWYLTVDDDKEKGGLIAIMTEGHPRFGDSQVTVLTLTRVKNMKEADLFF